MFGIGSLLGVGRTLAKANIIRGTAGKLLGGGAKKSAGATITGTVRSLPGVGKVLGGRNPILTAGGAIGGTILGGAAAGAGAAAAGRLLSGGGRRRRRTNFANGRALSRALRRVEGFEKLVRRTFTITGGSLKPRKRKGCR